MHDEQLYLRNYSMKECLTKSKLRKTLEMRPNSHKMRYIELICGHLAECHPPSCSEQQTLQIEVFDLKLEM